MLVLVDTNVVLRYRHLSGAEALLLIHDLEGFFGPVHEPASAYQDWKTLVSKYRVLGKQTHDARIVASMLSLGITHILTLNPKDFARYSEISLIVP